MKIIDALSRAQQKYQPINPDNGLLAQVQALTRDNTVLKAQLDSQNKPTDASIETTPMSLTKPMNTSPPSSSSLPTTVTAAAKDGQSYTTPSSLILASLRGETHKRPRIDHPDQASSPLELIDYYTWNPPFTRPLRHSAPSSSTMAPLVNWFIPRLTDRESPLTKKEFESKVNHFFQTYNKIPKVRRKPCQPCGGPSRSTPLNSMTSHSQC